MPIFKLDSAEYRLLSKAVITLEREIEQLRTKLDGFETRYRKLEGKLYSQGIPSEEKEAKSISIGDGRPL